MLSMRVAVSERVKRGERWEEETTWVGVAVFGNRAEALNRLGLEKGTKIYAQGPAKVRAFERKNGEPGASLDLIARELVLLGGGRRGGGSRAEYGSEGNAIGGSGTAPSEDNFGDDDIPF